MELIICESMCLCEKILRKYHYHHMGIITVQINLCIQKGLIKAVFDCQCEVTLSGKLKWYRNHGNVVFSRASKVLNSEKISNCSCSGTYCRANQE